MNGGVAELLERTTQAYAGRPVALERAQQIADRSDGTLRIALAGMVESGKSTLLNAILGKELAATDAGENTRIVTWYRYRRAPRVTVHLSDGMRLIRPFTRDGDRVLFDLAGHDPEEIDRLVVDWPAEILKTVTFIDTPGTGSLTPTASARTEAVLVPEHSVPDADAVIYLMRHLHEEDVRFLAALGESIGDTRAGAVVVGVLSRADEVGGGRIDSLLSARTIAERYRSEPGVSRLVAGVMPVAGLLARAARSFRDVEFEWLTCIARMERRERAALLFSVGRFLGSRGDEVLEVGIRQQLLDRFGLYGIRIAAVLIDGGIESAAGLAEELSRGSGFERLLAFIDEQYLRRADQLTTSSAVGAVSALLREDPPPAGAEELEAMVERLQAEGLHGWVESRLLAELRGSRHPLDPAELADARRLLGAEGLDAAGRLGLQVSGEQPQLLRAAVEAAERWRSREAAALDAADGTTARIADVVARSAEHLLFSAAETGGSVRRLSLRTPEPRPGAGQEADDERHAG